MVSMLAGLDGSDHIPEQDEPRPRPNDTLPARASMDAGDVASMASPGILGFPPVCQATRLLSTPPGDEQFVEWRWD